MKHRIVLIFTLLAGALGAAYIAPSIADAASCGSGHIESNCPPNSQHKAVYPSNYTYLNAGNAESVAFTRALQSANAEFPGWRPNGLTGTTWTWRSSNTFVTAVVWLFDAGARIACRYAYDVSGTNGHTNWIGGSRNWCQYY